jgi:hypothetical protein
MFLLDSGFWKYITTKDITNSTIEIIHIVMIPASIAWFARKDESLHKEVTSVVQVAANKKSFEFEGKRYKIHRKIG